MLFWGKMLQGTHVQLEAGPGGDAIAWKETAAGDTLVQTDEDGDATEGGTH